MIKFLWEKYDKASSEINMLVLGLIGVLLFFFLLGAAFDFFGPEIILKYLNKFFEKILTLDIFALTLFVITCFLLIGYFVAGLLEVFNANLYYKGYTSKPTIILLILNFFIVLDLFVLVLTSVYSLSLYILAYFLYTILDYLFRYVIKSHVEKDMKRLHKKGSLTDLRFKSYDRYYIKYPIMPLTILRCFCAIFSFLLMCFMPVHYQNCVAQSVSLIMIAVILVNDYFSWFYRFKLMQSSKQAACGGEKSTQ